MTSNPSSKPFQFPCGKTSKNRFMLAPMTNTQSHENGMLSDEEYHWLTLRAKGGFGITMTCAAHVQKLGKGFPGQLGIYSNEHIEGHKKLSTGIQAHNSLALIQLHHAGMRSPKDLIGESPLCPSENLKYGARAMTLEEVEQLRDDFVIAAKRAQESGYDGVEVHGAHGYIISQFLSSDINKRADKYGGNLENRSRLLFEIVDAIRQICGSNFILGVRLSPERFGMKLEEVKAISQLLIEEGRIDFLDISLWDVFKMPEEKTHQNLSLLEHFTGLDRGDVKLTVAGKISTGQDVRRVIEAGVDFVSIGRAAILHHDYPKQVMVHESFTPIETPVTQDYLRKQGLGKAFIEYMQRWEGFVSKEGKS